MLLFTRSQPKHACPSEDDLRGYAGKTLIGKRNEAVFQHLKLCAECLRRAARITQGPTPDELIAGPPRRSWWQRLCHWRPWRR